MDYSWVINGLSMDYPWIIHGLSMDYPWIIHGLSMDYPWIIHGLSIDHLSISIDIHGKPNWLFFKFGMPFPIPASQITN
jgi:FtsP/CotA-like multicopper oxidase with cupredoxin domain